MLENVPRDSMTGFYVKSGLIPFLEKLMRESELHGKKISVVLFDLDHLKKVNDRFGHLRGDDVLKEIAGTLRAILQDYGFVFRYGGDEFVTVFLGSLPEEILRLAHRCRREVSNHIFTFETHKFKLKLSCGIAEFTGTERYADELIKRADDAMYFSKRYGGNLVTQSNKVRYIKLRNRRITAAVIAVLIFSAFITNEYFLKGFINKARQRVKSIKIVRGFDMVILKNGSIVRGNILQEQEDFVLIRLSAEEGSAELVLDRSEIEEIVHISE